MATFSPFRILGYLPCKNYRAKKWKREIVAPGFHRHTQKCVTEKIKWSLPASIDILGNVSYKDKSFIRRQVFDDVNTVNLYLSNKDQCDLLLRDKNWQCVFDITRLEEYKLKKNRDKESL